jgi:hypothetical protein
MSRTAEKPKAMPGRENGLTPYYPVVPEVIGMAYRIKELHDSYGVRSIGCNGQLGVQLSERAFFDLFSPEGHDGETYAPYDHYSVVVHGVTFYCLVERKSRGR